MVAAFFIGGYFGVGHLVDPARARELATALDAAIPFVPWPIYVYLGVFPAAFAPLFCVRSRRLFRRVAAAYMIAIAISLAVFVAWPVTSAGLRADLPQGGHRSFTAWCLELVYTLDPPVNLLPSLHLSIAGLAAAGLWTARRAYGAVALAAVAAIGVSICTVKQHFVVDGIAGLALTAAIYAVVLRGFEAQDGEEPTAYSWKGPALYLLFVALVYAGLFTAYLVSFRLGLQATAAG